MSKFSMKKALRKIFGDSCDVCGRPIREGDIYQEFSKKLFSQYSHLKVFSKKGKVTLCLKCGDRMGKLLLFEDYKKFEKEFGKKLEIIVML